MSVPLQFLAILNMLAALAYMSQASSIFEEPLVKYKQTFRITFIITSKLQTILKNITLDKY